MIKENQKHLNRLQIVIDAFIMVASLTLSWYFRFISGYIHIDDSHMTFSQYLLPLIAIVPMYLMIYSFFRLYTPFRMKNRFEEFNNILKSNLVGILLFVLLLYVFKIIDYSRYLLVIFAILNTGLTFIERLIIRATLQNIRKKGYNQKHVLLVGYSELTEELLLRFRKHKHWGYNVIGILDDKRFAKNNIMSKEDSNIHFTEPYEEIAATSVLYEDLDQIIIHNGMSPNDKIIGNIDCLEVYLDKYSIDEVFITISINEYGKLEKIINTCEKVGVRAQIVPDYFKYIPAKPYVEEVDGLPIINLRYVPLDNLFSSYIKRIFDIVVSLICIVGFSPVMILTAIFVKLTSSGPALFKQERIGLGKKIFHMYKFRSMKVQETGIEERQWTTSEDTRKTVFGSFIRRTSIDELPQLFNVLKGDMSLIGPRPERPYYVDKFKEEISQYMVKHHVKPGMTGWAQVNGWRGDTSIEKRIEYDLYYIENWSFLFDLKILVYTVFKGFVNKNAY